MHGDDQQGRLRFAWRITARADSARQLNADDGILRFVGLQQFVYVGPRHLRIHRQINAQQFGTHPEAVPVRIPQARLAGNDAKGLEESITVHEGTIGNRNAGRFSGRQLAVDADELHLAALTTSTSLITIFCFVLLVIVWVAGGVPSLGVRPRGTLIWISRSWLKELSTAAPRSGSNQVRPAIFPDSICIFIPG